MYYMRLSRFRSRRILLISLTILFHAIILIEKIPWSAPLGIDPILRFYVLQGSFNDLLHNVVFLELAPPGWHIISWFVLRISPFKPILTFQIFNSIVFLLIVPVSFLLGKKLAGPLTGYFSAILVPLNITFYNAVARGDQYMLLALSGLAFITISIYTINSKNPKKSIYISYSILALFTASIHYLALSLVGAVIFIGTIRKWNMSETGWNWVIAHIPLVVGSVLWFPSLLSQYHWYSNRISTGTSIGIIIPTGIGKAIFPTQVSHDFSLFILGLVFVASGVSGFIALWGWKNINNPDVNILWSVLLLSGFALLLYDILIGGVTPRYSIFLISPTIIAVSIGLVSIYKHLYLSNHNPKKQVLATAVLLIIIAPFLVTATVEDTTNTDALDGDNYATAAEAVDEHMETKGNNTVVLSTLHVGEGALRFYNSGEYPVHGIPVSAFTQHRLQTPLHSQQVFNSTNQSHVNRLDKLVENKEYVLVYVVHGEQQKRFARLDTALSERGYELINHRGSLRAGVYIYQRTP